MLYAMQSPRHRLEQQKCSVLHKATRGGEGNCVVTLLENIDTGLITSVVEACSGSREKRPPRSPGTCQAGSLLCREEEVRLSPSLAAGAYACRQKQEAGLTKPTLLAQQTSLLQSTLAWLSLTCTQTLADCAAEERRVGRTRHKRQTSLCMHCFAELVYSYFKVHLS